MDTIGSYDAKTHLPGLLDRVAKGERITITRHGVPVARLVPVGTSTPAERGQAVEALRLFRKGRKLGGLKLRSLIEEGRRF